MTYSTGSGPNSVAAADVNGDNKPDIIVTNIGANNVGVLLNTGNGAFADQVTYSTGSTPRYVAAADVNGDSKPDIIVANYGTNNVGVLLNTGNGTFANQVTYSTGSSSRPYSVAAADVNGDTKLDIIVANNDAANVGVFLNTGNGTFAAQMTYSTGSSSSPSSVAAVDVNGDSKPDIIVANYYADNVGVLFNTGSGTFAAQMTYPTDSGSHPYHVTAADVNGDSKSDIILVKYNAYNVGVLLNTGDGTFTAEATYSPTSGPISAAVADVNGDNKRDIIVANNGANNVGVILNTGNGSFATQMTYPTGSGPHPYSVAAADVNGDSKPDIIAANYGTNNVSVLLNIGNGTFADQVTYSTGSTPRSVAAADVNGDSKPDIIVANYGTNNVSVLLNIGNGTFADQVTYSTGSSSYPYSVAAVDVNGDSKPDIIVANYGANNVGVLLNTGNGAFVAQVTYSTGSSSRPYSVAAADVNGDTKADVIVANYGANNVGVLLNTGNGAFVAQVTYSTGSNSRPYSVAAADVNGDSKPDIIVANYGTSNVGVLLNTGNGTFADQVTYSTGSNSRPYSVAATDVNGDSKPDMIVANNGGRNVGVFLNTGDGTFAAQMTYSTGPNTYPRSVAAADVNGDTKADVIVANDNANNIGVFLADCN